DVLRFKWKALTIAEPSVIGLGDDRKMKLLGSTVTHRKRAYRVTDDADLIRVRDADRRTDHSLLCHPGQTCHFAVAIEREGACKDVVGPDLRSARPNSCNSCAHDAGDIAYQSEVPDFDTCNVGNRVELSSR